jgi:hypothetical protein
MIDISSKADGGVLNAEYSTISIEGTIFRRIIAHRVSPTIPFSNASIVSLPLPLLLS